MRTQILMIATLGIFNFSNAQEVPQSQIPSVIVNQFNSKFSKATDAEWEIQGTTYNVEFETGWNIDHEIWYTSEGKILKHKEDISVSELPKAVHNRINTDFKGYSIDDLQRITEGNKVVYKMELNSLLQQDWDVVISSEGIVLSKMAD